MQTGIKMLWALKYKVYLSWNDTKCSLMCESNTYFLTNTGFNLGFASSSESVYSSYSDD